MADDDSQILIPDSFLALYVDAGRHRPRITRDELAQRYELCEDMATMLVDTATTQQWQLGVMPQDVLERMLRGLEGGEAGVSPDEARWVLRRLAELAGWHEVAWDTIPGWVRDERPGG
jgi:hypothetical protein